MDDDPARAAAGGVGVLRRTADVDWLLLPNAVETGLGTHPTAAARDDLVTAAVVVVLAPGPLVLLTRVAARGWDLPGGHREAGEGARDAAARELAEETGLLLPAGQLTAAGWVRMLVGAPRPAVYRYPHPETFMVAFAARAPGAAPVAPAPGSECTAAAWAPPADALAHLRGSAWAPLVAELARG